MAVSDEEEALFAAVNCEAHAMGLKASWIPCYLGTGFARWKELGFDAAYMQPNHMFNKYDAAMLGEFSQSCTRYGLGVELELNYTAVNPGENRDSEIERYYDYLRGGYYYGYIGCDTATYQGAGPGYIYTACYAEDPAVRADLRQHLPLSQGYADARRAARRRDALRAADRRQLPRRPVAGGRQRNLRARHDV